MDKIKRDSFVFYRSFYEAINQLSDDQALVMFKIITRYALDGDEPEGEGISIALFNLVRPQIDANTRKYLNGKKNKGKNARPDNDDGFIMM